MSSNRVTVYEAADQLGLSVDAIRKRVQRGSIPYEKDTSGRVHILLDESSTLHDVVQDSYETPSLSLIEELREQNAYLRTLLNTEREARTEENRRKDEENRRKDHIIAGLVQRIPELEAAEEMHESYDDGHKEHPQRGEHPNEGYTPYEETPEPQTAAQRPWWKRIFGG